MNVLQKERPKAFLTEAESLKTGRQAVTTYSKDKFKDALIRFFF